MIYSTIKANSGVARFVRALQTASVIFSLKNKAQNNTAKVILIDNNS